MSEFYTLDGEEVRMAPPDTGVPDVQAIIPASGFVAVFADGKGGCFVRPVGAWGLVKVYEQETDDRLSYYTAVKALVPTDGGYLEPVGFTPGEWCIDAVREGDEVALAEAKREAKKLNRGA